MTLPQNYQRTSGSLFITPDTVEDWTGTNTTPTLDTDPTHLKIGTGGVRTTCDTAGTRCYIVKTISTAGTALGRVFRMWVYVTSLPADIELVYFMLSTNSGQTTYKYYAWAGSAFEQGWNLLTAAKSDFTTEGSANWETSTFIRAQLYARPKSGKNLDITWGPIYTGEESRCKVILTFDDCYISQINTVKPILEAAGFSAALFVPSNAVGGAGKMTLADLHTMEDAGFLVCNHTSDHPLPSSQTAAQYLASLEGYRTWAVANGFTAGMNFFAHSYGGHNAAQRAILEANGVLCARSITNRIQVPCEEEMYMLHAYAPWNTTTAATAIGWLNLAESAGATIIYCFHDIATTASVTTQWETVKLQALVDAIATKVKRGQCDVVRYDEWFYGLENPRYRSVPIVRP